ncbi:hypothetical protein B0T13DRAFT_464338 [Neurospora crassa]|nr:hypothetical protein B0T13DRAFT_464338 [Neurospora crassa]
MATEAVYRNCGLLFFFFSNLRYLPCTYILLMRPSLDMPLTYSPPLLSITSHTHALLSLFFFPLMFVCCHWYVLDDANPNHLLLPWCFFFLLFSSFALACWPSMTLTHHPSFQAYPPSLRNNLKVNILPRW